MTLRYRADRVEVPIIEVGEIIQGQDVINSPKFLESSEKEN